MLKQSVDWLIFNLFNLAPEKAITITLDFFIYNSLKILLLLLVITHLMSLFRYYLPVNKLRDFLTQHKFFGLDYFFAALFGALTPFCSCSSIPLFIGFVGARIPLGVTFAFLITSPLVNEVAMALFVGLFGWKVAIIYVAAGILIGMIGGFILGKLNLERYVKKYVFAIDFKDKSVEQKKLKPSWELFKIISKEAMGITKKIILYVFLGVGVGALIHGYVAEDFFTKHVPSDNPWAVPLAVVLAVPLYSGASGVIPVVQSLVDKGVPMGTALAFMMAVVGLSLPEALILKRVMRLPLLVIFFAVVTAGIILIGYGFNWVL